MKTKTPLTSFFIFLLISTLFFGFMSYPVLAIDDSNTVNWEDYQTGVTSGSSGIYAWGRDYGTDSYISVSTVNESTKSVFQYAQYGQDDDKMSINYLFQDDTFINSTLFWLRFRFRGYPNALTTNTHSRIDYNFLKNGISQILLRIEEYDVANNEFFRIQFFDANGTGINIDTSVLDNDWHEFGFFINKTGQVASGTIFNYTIVDTDFNIIASNEGTYRIFEGTFDYYNELEITTLTTTASETFSGKITNHIGSIKTIFSGFDVDTVLYPVDAYDYIGNLAYDDIIYDDQYNVYEQKFDYFFSGDIKAFDLIVDFQQYLDDPNLNNYILYINGHHNASWTNPVAFIPFNNFYYLRWYNIDLNITAEKLIFELFHNGQNPDGQYWIAGVTFSDNDGDGKSEMHRALGAEFQNGIYGDGVQTNLDLNYRMYYLNGTVTGNIRLTLIPDKDEWFWLDEMSIRCINFEFEPVFFRVVNETNIVVVEPIYVEVYAGTERNLLIPTTFGTGNWSLQARRLSQDWTDVNNLAYRNFTVTEIDTRYAITVTKDYIPLDGFQGVVFTAYTGERYTLNMILSGIQTNITSSWTSPTYTYDQIVTINELFLCDIAGSFYIEMINISDSATIGSTKIFLVSGLPEENIYTVSIVPDPIKYIYTATLLITRHGYKDYSYFVTNPNGIQIASGSSGLSELSVPLYFTETEIGICDVYVFDKGGTILDNNAIHITFTVYDPTAPIGDEVIDTFIGLPDWVKAFAGVLLVLGFTFLPLLAMTGLKGLKFKVDVPPVIYAITGGCGVIFATLLQLWGWEVPFFITVIAIVSLLISYMWQHKGD